MLNRYVTLAVMMNLCLAAGEAEAAEITLKPDNNAGMAVSIYNQNLALIKDSRRVDLKSGEAKVAFEGVAQQMKPETALLKAPGVKVLEQNYEYDLLTPVNILEESVGQKVMTVTTNPANGQNMFDKADIISSNYGNPLLKFSYGIEANFPGRLVYENLPENLRVKPTLVVKLDNQNDGSKDLTLNYLTNGLSWQANYVAEITSDSQMDLQGWVTLNNQSGADYKDAEVQLIAGDVKQENGNVRPQPRNLMMAAKSVSFDAAGAAESASLPAENLGEYYVYSLPFKTDIMDKQSKQVSLMDLKGVEFEQSYRLTSPLNVSSTYASGDFERLHPSTVYKLTNSEENKLGLPMPSGVVRFYDKDGSGELQFIGAADMAQLAKGEKAELAIGEAFDIYADGKITAQNKLSEKMAENEVSVTFHNAKGRDAAVEFVQTFYYQTEIVSESLPSDRSKARTFKWLVNVPAGGETTLTYKVRVTYN